MRARRPASSPSRTLHISFICSALALGTAWLAAQEAAAPKAVEPAPPAAQQFKQAAIIRFEGTITPWLQGYLERKLAAAKDAGADLIVLEIDSPGGHLHESSNIAQKLNNLQGVHTVAYIPREALSGAALVSLGCDEIILHPSARIGDVGVIFLDEDFMFRHAPEKVRSPLVTEMRELAADHQRPPAIVESMVDLEAEVFRYVNQRTNAEEFMSEKEVTSKADAPDWQKQELVLESKKGSFLTVTGNRAKELRLAEGTVNSVEELKARYQVAGKWHEYRADSVDTTVYVLNLWYVTGLLFIIGLVGILYECMAPGTCIGGLIGLLCFALFYWSRFLGGTAGWLELVLFVVGLVCLGIELFVLPGFGVAGVMGLTMIGISIVLACQTFVLPETTSDLKTMTSGVALLLASGVIFLGIAYGMTTYLGKMPVLSQLILAPVPSPGGEDHHSHVDDADQGVPAAKKVPIGSLGKSTTILRPSGRAIIDGQPVDVVSTGEVIGVGVKIRVVEVGYGRIIVEEAEPLT